ncbi:MAG: hypothetical protein CMG00_09195 [Candidatus Marinimicrobia bacterium]|nr:hypothetical protein [Candidatus Neomarinimicrobiota bacterium]|tara:strand:- start:8462 stop:8731 length:270 start_codon:yes stop_codon:yes gene_type:complete
MIKDFKKELDVFIKENKNIKKSTILSETEKVIPKNILKGVKNIDIKKQTITIKTKNPSWRQETLFLKKEIMKKIAEKLPNYNIKKIIIL